MHTNPNLSYASLLQPRQAAQLQHKQSAAAISKSDLCPVTIEHGELTINFTLDEVNEFTREEGLHQAVFMKFSYGKPDIQEIRRLFQSQFEVQGSYRIGQLEYRHLLVRFDVYSDYVQFLSRTVGYLTCKDEEYMFRTFPWTLDFNPKEETSMAVVWISLPELPPNLFAKKSVLSIASAVGKPLAVDKATHDRTRPNTARVKILIDLLKERPNNVKLRVVDKSTGKSLVFYQKIIYDNLPKYCCCCKHQGHEEQACRFLEGKNQQNIITDGTNPQRNKDSTVGNNLLGSSKNSVEQLKGDARHFLNDKRTAQAAEGAGKQSDSQKNEATDNAGVHFDRTVATAEVQRTDQTDAKYWVPKKNVLPTVNKGDDESKKGEIWNVVTNRKSHAKKDASTNQLTLGAKQKFYSNLNRLNAFEVLELDETRQNLEGQKIGSTVQNCDMISNQMVPYQRDGKELQTNVNSALDIDARPFHPLKLSSPHVEEIIKKAQIQMMTHPNITKQPLVMLNTSVQEVPSQSWESNGEYGVELKMSSGSNNDVTKAISRKMATGNQYDLHEDEDSTDVYSTEEENCEREEEEKLSDGSTSVGKSDEEEKPKGKLGHQQQQEEASRNRTGQQQIISMFGHEQYNSETMHVDATARSGKGQQQHRIEGTPKATNMAVVTGKANARQQQTIIFETVSSGQNQQVLSNNDGTSIRAGHSSLKKPHLSEATAMQQQQQLMLHKDTNSTKQQKRCKNSQGITKSGNEQVCLSQSVQHTSKNVQSANEGEDDNEEEYSQYDGESGQDEDNDDDEGDASEEGTYGSEDEMLSVGSPTIKNSSSNLNAKASAFVPKLTRQQQQGCAIAPEMEMDEEQYAAAQKKHDADQYGDGQHSAKSEKGQQQHRLGGSPKATYMATSDRTGATTDLTAPTRSIAGQQHNTKNADQQGDGQQQISSTVACKSGKKQTQSVSVEEDITAVCKVQQEQHQSVIGMVSSDRTTEKNSKHGQQNLMQNARVISSEEKKELQALENTIASSSSRNQPRRGMPRFRNTYRSGEVPIQCDTQSAIETTIEDLARASEEKNVRQLPMRVAKQKQVVSNTSKNPNRYKK